MFKFDFNSTESQNQNDNKTENNDHKWTVSKELRLDTIENLDSIINCSKKNIITLGSLGIYYLASADVLSILKSQNEKLSVVSAEQNHSDLVTAVYEGGLKIWECTYDLLNFISSRKLDFKNKRVLDLGCGSGIVGILATLSGSVCYFQDYNEEVIKYITIPNVMVNLKKNPRKRMHKSKFFSGDWKSFLDLVENDFNDDVNKFDYIFTSETIYNTDNYTKLINIFKHLLKRNGKVYLAAKSYYFGVGGGISSFQEALDKDIFSYKNCWQCHEGIKRGILEINFK